MEKDNAEEVFPLQLIQQFFDTFVSKITENQLSKEVNESDVELSAFIIKSFSKLFTVWNEHLFLHNYLKSNLFYDVYSQMFDSFNYNLNVVNHKVSENTIPLECKICDQEFTVMNSDFNYAYISHLNDPVHLEMVNVFQRFGQNDPNSSTYDETKVDNIIEHSKQQDSEIQREYIRKNYYCDLCKITLKEKELRKHMHGKAHCHLKKQLEKYYRLSQKKECIKIIRTDSYEFVCEICNITNAGWMEILNHCSSASHKYLKSTIAVKSNARTRKRNKSRRYADSQETRHVT